MIACLGAGISTLPACSGPTGAKAQRDFDLSRTYYRMGADYLRKRRPLDAKRELKKSIKLDPQHRDPVYMLGVLLFVEAMHKLNIIDRSQCLKGNEADEQRKVANEVFRRAEKQFKKARKMAKEFEDKPDTDSTIYLANIALHFKRYKEAIKLSKIAMKNDVHPSRHLALAVLGWAYFKLGKLDKAARELRQSMYDRPKFCLGRYRLAKVYFELKHYVRASAELDKIKDLKVCPIQEIPHLMGLTQMRLKKEPAQASKHFDDCAKLNPNSCLAKECTQLGKNISHLTGGGGLGTVEGTPEGQ